MMSKTTITTTNEIVLCKILGKIHYIRWVVSWGLKIGGERW